MARPVSAWFPRTPAPALFGVSAMFHYVGPALAVLMFTAVSPAGVAWLRVVSAAAVLLLWRRPWRLLRRADPVLLLLGVVLAAMNTLFYLAVDLLPLSTVGSVEFLGVIVLAAVGVRGPRNLAALLLGVGGVAVLTDIRVLAEPLGFVFAFGNCALFVLYVMLGHRIANARAGTGVDRLAVAMGVAAVATTPFGVVPAAEAFGDPALVLQGVAVGVCSSVVPYVIDQIVMARMERSGFALMLCLLPAMACVIGLVVLGQVPVAAELAGIGMVAAGVAIHQPGARAGPRDDRRLDTISDTNPKETQWNI